MRLIIDMQGLQTKASKGRGVGRYTDHIVSEIIKQKPDYEIILAANGYYADEVDRIRQRFSDKSPNVRVVCWNSTDRVTGVGDAPTYIVEAGEAVREGFLNSFDPDVIFCPNLQEGLFEPAVTSVGLVPSRALYVSTLHDLVPLKYKKEYLGDPRVADWYQRKLDHARRSNLIMTVSEASKNEIVSNLDINPDRVVVAHNGIDTDIFNNLPLDTRLAKDVLSGYGITTDYILYIGGADSHKNLARLVDAYSRLSISLRNKYSLVLAGAGLSSNSDVKGKIASLGIEENVITPGFVLDHHLPILYKSSACFVLPSTDEGFGLPAAEAMACGVVTLGAKTSGVGEVVEHPAARFDPYDIESIKAAIQTALTDEKTRASIIEAGLKRVESFSWSKAVRTMWQAVEAAASKHFVGTFAQENPCDRTLTAVSKVLHANDPGTIADFAEAISDSFMIRDGASVYVDISTVVVKDHRSGIQRVTRAIARELQLNGLNGVPVKLVYGRAGEKDFYYANTYCADIFGDDLPRCDDVVEFGANDTIIFLDLNPGLAIYHSKFAVLRRALGLRIYHVVYDILPLLRPETFWPELCDEFRAWARALSRSDGVLCISKAVATEFAAYIENHGHRRTTPLKVGYFHLGADLSASAPSTGLPDDAADVIRNLSASNSFLVVGTLEPRKGHRQTLKAFEQLWSEGHDYRLCFVGRVGWGMKEFVTKLNGHPELGKRLIWLSGVSDEFLEKIYSTSACLIAPSEGEGFGLPLIEAAQKGIPLLIRDIPVFREVAGHHAAYFPDSLSGSVIAEAVNEWSASYANGETRSSREMPWLTWKASAKQFSAVLEHEEWFAEVLCVGSVQSGAVLAHDSESFDWEGFSIAESTHRWTASDHSSIAFNWAGDTTEGDLVIVCSAHGSQRVSVKINGKPVFSSKLKGSDVELILPIDELKRGRNSIELTLPDAKAPGRHDPRLLGLAIKQIKFGRRAA
jgi:glycosyltransferase involved in cell wall biosynthesis